LRVFGVPNCSPNVQLNFPTVTSQLNFATMLLLVLNLEKQQLRGWTNKEDGRCEGWHHFSWLHIYVSRQNLGLT
jgi:hypothetical protein